LTSDTEGTTTVQASWDGTVADQSITRTSNEAEKDWVSELAAENLSVTICDNTEVDLLLSALGSNLGPDDNPITFTIWDSPGEGGVSGDLTEVSYPEGEEAANTGVTYAPGEDYIGEDAFIYQVEDSFGEFDQGLVSITVEDCGGDDEGGGGGALEKEVAINEVAWSGTRADSTHEWIELVNITEEEVDLTGWTLRWRRNPAEEWKEVRLRGTVEAEEYYLMERLSDETVSDIRADLIYDTEEPYSLPLLDEGEVMQLLNSDGLIVDTANADRPELGWPGGSVTPVDSMERVEPELEDTRENWASNEGIIIKGKDRDIVDLTASAQMINEKTLLARTFTGTPKQIVAGRSLTFTVRSTDDPGEEPKILLAGTSGMVAGGAGSAISGEEGVLTAETVPGLPNYQVTFDTSKVQPGTYKVFIVRGNRIIHKQLFEVIEEG